MGCRQTLDERYPPLIDWLANHARAKTDVLLPHLKVTPLYYAADKGDLGIVRILLSAGANANMVFKHLPSGTYYLAHCGCYTYNEGWQGFGSAWALVHGILRCATQCELTRAQGFGSAWALVHGILRCATQCELTRAQGPAARDRVYNHCEPIGVAASNQPPCWGCWGCWGCCARNVFV